MKFQIYVPVGCQTKDVLDDNMDINIIIEGSNVYFATLFAIRNIERLLFGRPTDFKYFWSTNMIVVRDMGMETVKAAIAELIAQGDLEDACACIGNVDDVFLDDSFAEKVL